MARNADLLPCPFCGNSAIVPSSVLPGRGFCEECGAEGPWSPCFEGDWNTRVPDPRVAALIEAAAPYVAPMQTADYARQMRQHDALVVALAAFKGGARGC